MTRRDLLKTPAGAAFANTKNSITAIESEIVRLKLRHTWTTVMSSSDSRDTFHLRYIRDGITGHGEGAPISRYGETAITARAAIDRVGEYLKTADPWQFSKLLAKVFGRIE